MPVRLGEVRHLSPMQRSLWVSQRNHPDAPVQNMPLLSRIHGTVDAELLARSFAAVVEASDVLRTRLTGHGAEVALVPAAEAPASAIVAVDPAEVEAWARARGAAPLDLTVAGYDSAIATHPDGTASWYLNLHHVVTDATSSAMVFRATADVYFAALANGGRVSRPELGADYYAWSRALGRRLDDGGDPRADRALRFWKDRPPAPRIGRLYTSVEQPTPDAARLPLPLGPQLLADIEDRLRNDYRMLTDDLAWSTLLVTATALYLHRVGGADRFAIGLPIHHRNEPETRDLIGPTMEVFPVDVEIRPDDTHRELHRRVGRSILQTLRHALPGTAPAADYEGIVNVIPRAEQDRFGDYPSSTAWLHSGSIDANHLLRVQMTRYAPSGETSAEVADADGPVTGFDFALDLNLGGSEDHHRARAGGHLITIVTDLVSDPDQPVGARTLCGPDELDQIRRWEYRRDFPTPTESTIVRLQRALAGGPDVVLEGADRSLTGAELWDRARAIANGLRAAGVGRGIRVGVELARSVDAVVAILAVHRAGGSFVPLDPALPVVRRRRLADRAGCVLVLSAADQLERLAESAGPEPGPLPHRSDDHEAYLLFTSGSTGEPKGVPILDVGLARYLRFAEEAYVDQDGPPPIAPLFSALTFDLTITSLFVPILAGGRVIVIEADGPAGLSAIAARPEITWCKATPSHLELLVRILPDDHGLNTLVVGGEAFGTALARRLLAARPDLAIFNEYGPTEAVVGCMEYLVEPGLLDQQSDVPIGRPAPGVTLVVVDEHLQRVPIGAPGELLIAHDGLTPGYLVDPAGDPAETEALLAPFVEVEGRRFYRSGDLVRLQDGQRLVYLGRRDEQVKVGGIRLEPVEVEAALDAHPAIERTAVRLWSPREARPSAHCVRCGLPDNVPGIRFDDLGVCGTCHDFDRVAPIAQSWFRTPDDLRAKLADVRSRATGDHDCLHLLSGGKDSTYALYQLVELGFRPYALTLDNGFISEGAKANVRRSVADLGIDHEFATAETMNEIFRDSLERHSNVCHGCYKAIYTLATARAVEIGAPLIVTGLSRGQLFETRLIPQQFDENRFDPDAIDRAVLEARKLYHRADDGPNRLLDTSVFAEDAFESGDVFDRVEYLDFYRYIDVELAEMLTFLDQRAPWTRPDDTGRSTNCLINAAGIHTHQTEQGYHNYAVPYAWDVRLGHKTRDEAIEELDDRLDLEDVGRMLDEVGYRPTPRQVLTAWVEPSDDAALPSPAELRNFLAESLPAHAIPAAFVSVDRIPLTGNGKLDDRALPAPDRVHRPGPALRLTATTPLQRRIIDVWERILKIEPIGPDDDFFVLGGDSLAALEMIVALGDALERSLGEDLAFTNTSPRALAEAIELLAQGDQPPSAGDDPRRFRTPDGEAPARSAGELAILYDQAERPDAVMYNVARQYLADGQVDGPAFAEAVRTVAAIHQPLRWTHGTTRRLLRSEDAVSVDLRTEAVAADRVEAVLAAAHRQPFDLDDGPLLRVVVQPIDDGTTAILLAAHHAAADAGSFERLWAQVDDALAGRPVVEPTVDYAGFMAWQAATREPTDAEHWLAAGEGPPARLAIAAPDSPGPDGFLIRRASIDARTLRDGARTGAAALALAAVARTVRAHASGPEIEIGLITSTRNHPAAADLVGYFLNTVPVRVPCQVDTPAEALAETAATAVGEALAHRTYPLASVVADRREAGRPEPALEVLMAFDHLDDLRLGDQRVSQRVLSNGTAVAPMTFFVEVRGDAVDLSMEYRGSVVPAELAAAMLDRLDVELATLAGRPGQSSGTGGPGRILVGPELPDLGLVATAIEANLAAGSATDAVVCGERSVTWTELADVVDRIAADLAEAGVVRGDPVLLCLPRSTDLVAAMLATHRVGAAYVPIDPGYPRSRIELIAEAAGANVGLVTEDNRDLVPEPIVVGGPPPDRSEAVGPAPVVIRPEDPAYIIFTSGSTGRPRGVPVTHGALAASTNARDGVYDRAPDRFLMVSSPAFDSSIVGLFWTLATGGTVVLPTEDQAHDPMALHHLMSGADGPVPSHTLMVPTLYRGLLTIANSELGPTPGSADPGRWPDHVIVAGEACPPSLVAAHHDHAPGSALTNEYGPTEATVWATAHHCRPGERVVPIGPPIPGAWVAVIDEVGSVRPDGVVGELIIGGPGVVAGYLDDPDATAARFGELPVDVIDPATAAAIGPHRRYFRTGDRAVVIGDTLRFLGRADTQLNVGGVRAEPEDLENALLAGGVAGVTEAVVVAADLRTTDELLADLSPAAVSRAMTEAATWPDPAAALRAGLLAATTRDLRLVAHIEVDPSADREAVVATLRANATDRLPGPIRPAVYQLHDRLPRTPNGKLDRAAADGLAIRRGDPAQAAGHDFAADGDRSVADEHTGEAPPALVEELTTMFGTALRVGGFGADDSFFDHGGHSLLAMELLLAIEDRLGRRLAAATLYDAPSPRALAARLHAGDRERERTTSFLVPIQPEGSKPPIFAVHVLGIDCEFFRPLAARLGPDQPMYGLGQPTDDLDTVGPTEVDDVAATYADAIDRVAPDGPVSLAAISLGGVVAYELAQQLRARGRTVRLLALFDALGPDAGAAMPSIGRRMTAHLDRARMDPARYLTEQADHQAKRDRRITERASLAVRHRLGIRADHRLEVRRFIEDNVSAQAAYTFDPYPGPMLVIKAGDDPFAELQLDHGMGWRTVAVGGLAIAQSPGGHLSMMAEPNVERVAALIVDALATAAETEADAAPGGRATIERLLI
ncbi:MAG: AMP-binding protein, partial [Actinomycetota bacterium]